MILCFDVETEPIPADPRELPKIVWCGVAVDVETGERFEAGPGDLEAFGRLLLKARRLVGHHIAHFDIPVLERRWDWFRYKGEVFDTLAAARLIFASNIYERSIKYQRAAGRSDEAREARLPSKFLKAHSLEAWGYRLGIPKQHADVDLDFFRQYSPELLERCKSDVDINVKLYRHLLEKPAEKGWDLCSELSLLNESRVAYIVGQQERNGVGFDTQAAQELYAKLADERSRLERELTTEVPGWIAAKGRPVTPKRSMVRKKGYAWPVRVEAGSEYQQIEYVTFNPGSGHHRVRVLQQQFGWQPKEFTEAGQAITDEKVLADLDYPIIPKLLQYLTVAKRLGQLAEGNEAWLKHDRGGRIHGRLLVTGTRTSRAAHMKPNLGQVPKVGKPYGEECRRLFKPTHPGWVQVGCDAQGLELRMLAHRLAYYDNGEFANIVLDGDPHKAFMKGTKIFIRDNQKTWTYAFLYGAGNEKLGTIILKDWRMAVEQGLVTEKVPSSRHAEDLGKVSRDSLMRHFGALELLLEKCRAAYERGWLRGLDGRVLVCRSSHGALNDLLQSDGAILVKHAMQWWWGQVVVAQGLPGQHWAPLLWVHDEWQLESEPEIADWIGAEMCDGIREAGNKLEVRCRMDGEYKIGRNWAECH